MQTSGIDVDVQAYQPAHEFINGEYIGVLNVREPNNKHYVYANYGWDDDEIDQWEMSPDSGYVQKCGTPDVYNELCDVLSPDAATPRPTRRSAVCSTSTSSPTTWLSSSTTVAATGLVTT